MKQIIFFLLFLWVQSAFAQSTVKNYVFFNRDRERIQEASFLNNPHLEGAQLKYTWKELEPSKGQYDFSEITADLAFLQENGKKLFIQLQDVSFDMRPPIIPDYLLEDSIYAGGAVQQYITDDQDNILRKDGFVAKRWNPALAERFGRLLEKLAEQFDGKIEGINLPETAVGFGETGKLYPADYSPTIYRDAILQQMQQAKAAFQQSVVIQYANFMPGEWRPWEDKGYLESLYLYAKEHEIGMGGPDIKIWKKAQMNHSYHFLKLYAEELTAGMAVQWGNYEEINPKTERQVTIAEIYEFGKEEIKAEYIFWCTQEPYYSQDLPVFLESIKK